MKTVRVALALMLALAAICAMAESDAQKSFAKIKSLEGTWEGKAPDGHSAKMKYHVVSGRTAVMSEIGDASMVTMFALDGDRLLMTHYCGAGNQPRMEGTLSPDGKSLDFNFIDATNLTTQQTGHMHHAHFTFADADHHSEQWTYRENGKDETHEFVLQRLQ
jgi:hypothetical protein